jgi:fructosamine-3-kinase
MKLWSDISTVISEASGQAFSIAKKSPVGGGSINDAYRIAGNDRVFFVKLNARDRLSMFESEADGLQELASAQAIRVPAPLCYGRVTARSYLVMEYIEFGGRGDAELLGCQLAQLHRVYSTSYGWHRDNTIGATAQINTPGTDWIEFWRDHRLGFQLRLAASKGYGGSLQAKGERLLVELSALYADYIPRASLLHGDLWAGNYASDGGGRPVIFDPAVYYGDREADLAMTELFGGFNRRFYDAYNDSYALDRGYGTRKTLYNLYHILNHLNLFGGGYGAQAEHMMARLLAELGA